ncbi:MAG: carboxypeptidase regulatory-like domain-containing protein, partial [Myxococcota bacterium]
MAGAALSAVSAAEPAAPAVATALTDADGRYALTLPAAGNYIVKVAQAGYAAQDTPITVAAGETRTA